MYMYVKHGKVVSGVRNKYIQHLLEEVFINISRIISILQIMNVSVTRRNRGYAN